MNYRSAPFTFDSSTDNTESSTLIDAGIYLLDYGAGNVRSLINAVHHLGLPSNTSSQQRTLTLQRYKIIFPGVGAFGSCMDKLDALGYIIPLKEYIASNRPFWEFGVGMHACLFSEESPTTEGLGIIDATVSKFDSRSKTVPHMGWNAAMVQSSRRIIACLDVRANDEGDLVVTKGDKYDVRVSTEAGGHVRNLGKPVELAKRYYEEGADEITFLNITSFRECPLRDFPMMQVLQKRV
ncbi:hypothetical protein BASA60_000858 [Batrachochytrium salamandrivorans]|nr:hypothetical protein BASA60_000858 [Batrachochytrium salamandrivorans]